MRTPQQGWVQDLLLWHALALPRKAGRRRRVQRLLDTVLKSKNDLKRGRNYQIDILFGDDKLPQLLDQQQLFQLHHDEPEENMQGYRQNIPIRSIK